MANDSLNYSTPSINLSLKQYDLLVESIAKIDALVQVAMQADLQELASSSVLYNYLWALHDIVYGASELCQKLEPQSTSTTAN